MLQKILRFIELGGVFKIAMPSESLLSAPLKKKIPLILNVKSAVLYELEPGQFGHDIVLNGESKNNFIINDPYFKGEYTINKKKLFFALCAQSIDASAYLLKAKPKKKIKKIEIPEMEEEKDLIEDIKW